MAHAAGSEEASEVAEGDLAEDLAEDTLAEAAPEEVGKVDS